MPIRPLVRPVFAVLCCLAAAGAMFYQADAYRLDRPLITGIGVIALLAGGMLALRSFWAAIAGRGLVWTALAMVTLCESLDRPHASITVAALALCAALLIAGRHALDGAPSTFQPSHHRGPLTLALVLGVADVATLTGWSLLASCAEPRLALGFLGLAVAVAVSLYGLARLRTWGFLLNLVVNLGVTALMLADVFRFHEARVIFIVPAVAQILLALPLLIAMVRRRPIAVPAAVARLGACIPVVAIVAMAAINLQVWFGQPVLAQLVRWGMRHG